MLQRVCVFCGAYPGKEILYQESAQQFGQLLAENDLTLIYGGASIGLMGMLADAVLAFGGRVIGVIPRTLAGKEIAHQGLTQLHVVNSMHERKALMAQLADAFVALPGGIGTMDEFFEIWTWAQLGLHQKPCGMLNVSGYYDALWQFIDQMIDQGFLASRHRELILVENSPELLLGGLKARAASASTHWIESSSL